jgi:hypothetical protein
MTNRQADIWVIRNWAWRVKHWDYDLNKKYNFDKLELKYPKLDNFIGYCAWCELFLGINGICYNKCLLRKMGDCCININSTWNRWNINPTKSKTRAMLKQCIKAIKTIRKYKDFSFIDDILKEYGIKLKGDYNGL